MLDRAAFLRPIAHRGLHDAARGVIENTAAAFEAAIAKGYGIECDLRPAAGGLPVVFHDETLERLDRGHRPLVGAGTGRARADRASRAARPASRRSRSSWTAARGRVPLLVEVKSEWEPVDRVFVGEIARACERLSRPARADVVRPGGVAR